MKKDKDNYKSLKEVFAQASYAAESGKGFDRHAAGQPFEDQPIMWIEKHFSSFQLGQAVKKLHESQRLECEAAVSELLGAINYIAARIIYLKGKNNE